ncbi:MAG: M23 family metallopeptidase, partial [Oscillospiraceae bacterium]
RTISGIRDFHTGIDIAGVNIYGKNIVASNDGVVSYVKNLNSGYGKHLMIDHGGGTYTLYAHTSAILVSPGQTVKKGQAIARVGSTGWSSGPHLHYEIWINKQRVNPITYFKK